MLSKLGVNALMKSEEVDPSIRGCGTRSPIFAKRSELLHSHPASGTVAHSGLHVPHLFSCSIAPAKKLDRRIANSTNSPSVRLQARTAQLNCSQDLLLEFVCRPDLPRFRSENGDRLLASSRQQTANHRP